MWTILWTMWSMQYTVDYKVDYMDLIEDYVEHVVDCSINTVHVHYSIELHLAHCTVLQYEFTIA